MKRKHSNPQPLQMDFAPFFLLLCFVLSFIYALTTTRHPKLPPGPYPFPIIGNLLQLGNKPHQSLATLSKQYGPLMSLKLGSRTTIVVSSPDVAKQFFNTHDMSISTRSVPDPVRAADHNKYSMAWLPIGDQWRKLRRITKEYIFSIQHLDASQHLRGKKVQELLDHVNRCCTTEKPVNIGAVVFTTTLNIFSNFLFSMDLAQFDSMSSQEFKDAVCGMMEVSGKPNIADFFPILKSLDPQGLVRQGHDHAKKILTIIDMIIDQRLQSRSSSSLYSSVSSTNDALDLLLNLNLKDESEFSRNDMRHLFLDIFIAGTDTTSSTLEWALAELIRNPRKLETARSELDKLMEESNTNIQECDISRLPYLNAVIKETFRLHPPGPLLLPRQAIHDVDVQGFIMPKNAQILFNVWAMGREPNFWPDPELFMPERFMGVETNYKGQDFELIPFGAGRRICPGLDIGHRMLHIILGSLIHKFEWKLIGNVRVEDMDMGEKFGMSLHKKVPLIIQHLKLVS